MFCFFPSGNAKVKTALKEGVLDLYGTNIYLYMIKGKKKKNARGKKKKNAKQMNGKKGWWEEESLLLAATHSCLLVSFLKWCVCHSHQHQQALGDQTWAFSPAACEELKEQRQCQRLQLSLDTTLQ